MDWSEWHPSGTVALDWLPLDMFYICVMIVAGWHSFGTKAYYYPRPPFVPTVCQKTMIFSGMGGSRPIITLVSDQFWPLASHAQHLHKQGRVALKNTQWHSSGRLANNWQSGCQLVKLTQIWSDWQWIGLSGIQVVQWHLIGYHLRCPTFVSLLLQNCIILAQMPIITLAPPPLCANGVPSNK